MKKLFIFLFVAVTALMLFHPAFANPFTSGKPSDMNAAAMGEFNLPFMTQIMGLQKSIHQAITDSITELKQGQSLAGLWGLLLISFGYGIFHVLAPGHGKVIVGSYFLGHEARWRDGVIAGLLMAVGHTITAVGIVVLLYLILGIGQFKVLDDARYFELMGYGMIAVIGLWLLYRAFKKPHGCGCGHTHHTHATHDHVHHDHPDQKAMSLFAAASLVPCTGSMIILLFTLANDILWAGVIAVIAIALGMWMTVTIIGTISIAIRRTVVGTTLPTRRQQITGKLLRIGAALIVVMTGTLLFAGTFYSMMG